MSDKASKIRLDQLLVERGLAESRAKAQALILAGKVFSGERRLDKAGLTLAADTAIEVRGAPHPWVSRGALKLVAGLDRFAVEGDVDATAADDPHHAVQPARGPGRRARAPRHADAGRHPGDAARGHRFAPWNAVVR